LEICQFLRKYYDLDGEIDLREYSQRLAKAKHPEEIYV